MPVLDWSFSRPNPAAMRALGYEGVVRYASYDPSKDLYPAERDAILAAGMDLGLVFEATAAGPLSGAPAGARDGARMFQRMQELGCPPGMAAYWAMDTNVSESDWPALEAYGRAFLAELGGVYPAGHYGESDVIDHLLDLGLIEYGWFAGATSWSNGRITSRAHLIQRVGNAPNGTDRNDVQISPWGSWLQAAAGLRPQGGGTPITDGAAPAAPLDQEDDMSLFIAVHPGEKLVIPIPTGTVDTVRLGHVGPDQQIGLQIGPDQTQLRGLGVEGGAATVIRDWENRTATVQPGDNILVVDNGIEPGKGVATIIGVTLYKAPR